MRDTIHIERYSVSTTGTVFCFVFKLWPSTFGQYWFSLVINNKIFCFRTIYIYLERISCKALKSVISQIFAFFLSLKMSLWNKLLKKKLSQIFVPQSLVSFGDGQYITSRRNMNKLPEFCKCCQRLLFIQIHINLSYICLKSLGFSLEIWLNFNYFPFEIW